MSRVLVVDDDAGVAFALERSLRSQGHEVKAVAFAEEALPLVESETPDLVILDLRLPGMSGEAALAEIKKLKPDLPVIVLTAHGTAETAMDALAGGAFDHLTKPVELEGLKRAVDKALARSVPVPTSGPPSAAVLVGRSKAMLEVGKRVGILARSDAAVLVRGESGTGKEHVARAIHERSARRDGPFVPVVAAALPEALLEAELFGVSRGAFTGALRDRAGKLEAARGGTLFLDEIGELTLGSQVKILRFLEDHIVERLGDGARRTVDLRVIAATNADLEARVRAGRFREDLYYRLNVVALELPPLRERRDDIPVLVEHFLRRMGGATVEPAALERLRAADWPGNVRELRNALEHAVALARGAAVSLEHLPETSLKAPSASGDRPFAALEAAVASCVTSGAGEDLHARLVSAVERAAIAKALEITGDNQVAATKLLGMNRSTFRKRMEEHGLLKGEAPSEASAGD